MDFGCGPGPTLSLILEQHGYQMEVFDPFYANDKTVLAKQYDFVTATEVVEHFREPGNSLCKMWSLVKPRGYLGIVTKLVINRSAFANWHYKNDNTHICFFSIETFEWLGKQWNAKPEFIGKDVIIFQKV